MAGAAHRLAERLRRLPLDGIVVYDLQDESARTAVPRPFPFTPAVESHAYSRLLRDLTGRSAVCYKCIGTMTEIEWRSWLDAAAHAYGIELLSPVGRPSARGAGQTMSLRRALQLAAAHAAGFTLGGVAIAERHVATSESHRMLAKGALGCKFFVSQTVYDAALTVRMLADYARDCRRTGAAPGRVVLTFAPIGRAKTLEFMKWLGIAVPPPTAQSILASAAPLTKSIEICRANLRRILDQDCARTVPLGIATESVSLKGDEAEASIDLFHALRDTLISADCAA